MSRYFRLYLKFIEFSFGRAMEFRVDFYFRIIMDAIYYVVSFSFFKILYLHTAQIGGWTEPQTLIFVGVFILIDAINMTLFSNNTWMLPYLVNKGDLDYYLVRPISSFFMTNFREFAVNSFVNLIMAFSLLAYTIYQYPLEISVGRLILFAVLVLNGAWLFHLVRLLFLLPVFWTHSGRGFEGVFWSLEKFMERPHGIFRGPIRIILMTILPLSLIASIPAEMIFQSNPLPYAAIGVSVCFLFFLAVLGVWRYAIRSYSSASS